MLRRAPLLCTTSNYTRLPDLSVVRTKSFHVAQPDLSNGMTLVLPFLRRIGLMLLLASVPARAQQRVVAYVPNWIDLSAFAGAIDYAQLTHINVAFENPKDADGNLSFDRRTDGLIAKAREHKVRVLVSIGGGSASEDRKIRNQYFELLSDARRAGFVAQLARYVTAHEFDGLDVDLEGPAINKDYGAFIEELARSLQPQGKLLTAALSQGYGGKKVSAATLAQLDFVNIMAYNATGSWEPNKPGPHSSLEFAQSNVTYWLERGLPKSKAVLGVPFYGHGFGKDFRKDEYSYAEIVGKYPGAEAADQAGATIWYNGRPTIRAKAMFVKEQGLGGVMIWSLDQDAKGAASLLSAIHDGLRGE